VATPDDIARALMELARTLLLAAILLVLAYSACVQTSQVRVPLNSAPEPLKMR